MSVLILGKNDINEDVKRILAGEGIDSTIKEDASEIVKLQFSSVIITEPPHFEALKADGTPSINLMDDAETTGLDSLKTKEKIVILLDYEEETHEYVTAKAISLAARLAEKKKSVVFLSKIVKSGFGDKELKYRKARNAGVNFIKYENLSVCYDKEAGRFIIDANDGVFNFSIATPYLVSAARRESPGMERINKKLRLRYGLGGMSYDGRFFLHSVFTPRRGIYYLDTFLVSPDDGQSLRQAIFPVIQDMAATGVEGYKSETASEFGLPEVDKDKCAFCYSCFRACAHGALEPDLESSSMKVTEPLCTSCGTCIAICPGKAIARKDGPGGEKGNGNCKIYCCENGAADAFSDVLPLLSEQGYSIVSERVACGGSVGAGMLISDVKDYETVIIACCHEDSCRHIDGDRRACKQAERAADLLNKAKLDKKRIKVIKVSHAMANVMKDNILNILEG